jgi:predicted ATPase
MGKTRLAIEVARSQLDYFAHGVWFASFVAVNAPEQMVYTVADALGISFFGQREPKEQLVDYLADKELLLILDNLEHLLSGVGLIKELLEAAPKIKILATSRERLNLQAEHVFDLGGLTVPDEGAIDAKDFDALQLFAQSAKHSRHDFVLDESTIPPITQICGLVEGMPLAIELAASWLRVLNLTDIATEIEKGIDLLESTARDLPSRHHSIRAVFDHSWQLLTQEEQVALRRLSVFQGGFRREAALEVADVSLPILASLVDKSFLSLTPNGRYRRHPLVIQYAQEKLSEYPGEKTQTEEKHGLYYLHFLQEKGKHLSSPRRKETLEAISEELTNVRAAWDWAVKVVRIEELKQSTFYLYDVYLILRPQEGLEVSGRAVEGLDENNPAHHAALGRLLVEHGTFQNDQGRHEEGGKAIRRGLDLLTA